MAKQLIFISGGGDNKSAGFYHFVARAWRGGALRPHAYIFGWSSGMTEFAPKFVRFLAFLDSFDPGDELYLIGVSAGGTAAINALSARPHIKKVVAVASPFQVRHNHYNPTIITSIIKARQVFASFDEATKSKICTVTGWYGGRVPSAHSLLSGIRNLRIFAFGHTAIIVITLLGRKRTLRKLLTQ